MISSISLQPGQLVADSFMSTSLRPTMGAILAGGFCCTFLSGIVSMQTYMYFRIYSKDRLPFRITVVLVWILDVLHTIMVCMSNWNYLIDWYGVLPHTDVIAWSLASTIAVTAILTFVSHCFFTHRLYALSNGNWMLAVPLFVLALSRVVLALATTAEMIRVDSFIEFVARFQWLLSVGLAISTVVDLVIAYGLCHYLKRSKSGFKSMDQVIDAIMLYTVRSGLITCLVTILSLVFWFSMPHDLIFLAFHFAISKLYANSLLATLNSRRSLQTRSQASSDKALEYAMPVRFPPAHIREESKSVDLDPSSVGHLAIAVSKTVRQDIDGQTVENVAINSPIAMSSIRFSSGDNDSDSVHKSMV